MNAASGSARRNSLMVLMGCPPCGRAIDGVSSKGHTSPHPHDSAEFRRSRRAKPSTAGHGLVPDWRTSRPAMPVTPLRDWSRLSRAGALRGGVDRVERLARRHEQTVPLGTAEADVAADLRQPDATDELGLRRPYGHAAVAHAAAGVRRAPHVAVHVAARAVGAALDAVHHEVAEELAVGQLVVAAHVEHVHLALTAGAGIPGALAGADDVELLVVGREREPVGVGHLVLGDDEIDAAARIDAIDAGRQLALAVADLQPLAQPRLEPARGVAGPTGRIGGALVELAAVRRIGEPVAAVRMRDDVVGRVEPLAVVLVGDERDGPVVLVAHHAPGQVLARELAALEVERVAVAVVRRLAEHGHAAVVLQPPELPVVGDVAPDEIASLAAPRGAFRPQRARP